MKGVYIHNQIEYRVEVSGDQFQQGDSLSCKLSAKNHGSSPAPAGGLFLELSLGNLKKVKEKADGAFDTIASAELAASGEIAPGDTKSFDWTFQLDKNCAISEKSQSLCLVYGNKELGASGHAQLTIEMDSVIRELVRTFESTYQFVVKGAKSSKGEVNIKIKPSSARRYSLINELTLQASFQGDALLVTHSFNVKRFDAGPSSLGVAKGKKDVKQRLEHSEYLPGGYLDHGFLESRIEEALKEVATEL